MSKPNSVGCYRQLNSSSLHKQQGETRSAEICVLLWNIMTWCHHYQITLKSQADSRVPQCDGLPSIQFSKQNSHCTCRCSNRSVKGFIPHVDLFATHLNHQIPLFVSPVPDEHAWDIDALNIIWSVFTAYAYPPTALLHRVIQKSGNETASLRSHST